MGNQSRTSPARRSVLLAALALVLLASFAAVRGALAQATAFALESPAAVTFDAQGNLYFAERGANVIRRLATDGTLSTIAGTGTQGFSGDGGPAAAAQFDSPAGLAIFTSGDLYIADTHNHRIRKLTASTGLVTTVAGDGVPGFAGDSGPASSSQLDSPSALAIAPNGDLYIADTGNHRIRTISSSTGVIATFAGNGTQGLSGDGGPAISASIDSPAGVALDSAGNVYLSDTHNHRIRRVDAATGVITTLAGSAAAASGLPSALGDAGPAAAASLALPHGLAVDASGNLYVADTADHRVRRIDGGTGVITTVAGQGSQAFAGDGGPAVAASLDSPRAVALTPAAQLLTISDAGNERIRQLDALPAPGPEIHTIAGLGPAVSGSSVTLGGAQVIAYGGGSVTASLAASGATGNVTFSDTTSANPVILGTAPLLNGAATFSTAALAAGIHTLLASFAGDSAHPAAQSQAFVLKITPLPITAAVQPQTILYGQPIPALAGSLQGVLPRDSASLSATFSTTAVALSPVATYPVSGLLTGAAAPNYTLLSTSGTLAIAKAPSSTTLTVSPGPPVSVAVQTASSTAGNPTGAITLLDGASVLASAALASGTASFSPAALAPGTHALVASYPGDANFLPSTSPVASLTVGTQSGDFTLADTGAPARAIPSGSAATFAFSISPQSGALVSPVTLSVSGLPPGASSSINPAYVPPGSAVTSVILTVQTVKLAAAAQPRSGKSTLAFALLGPVFLLLRRRVSSSHRRFSLLRVILASTSCIVFATLASGCGDRVHTSSDAQTAPIYTLTVTGTATSASGTVLQHTANVTLQLL